MDASTLATILGTVITVGLALATLIMRSTARLDMGRRAFQSAMDTFQAEMQRLAERQSHVEGWLDERGSADEPPGPEPRTDTFLPRAKAGSFLTCPDPKPCLAGPRQTLPHPARPSPATPSHARSIPAGAGEPGGERGPPRDDHVAGEQHFFVCQILRRHRKTGGSPLPKPGTPATPSPQPSPPTAPGT